MAAHYDREDESVEGGLRTTSFKVWYDDPRESINFGERGQAFPCRYDAPSPEREAAVDRAIGDAEAALPSQTVYEIRAKDRPRNARPDEIWRRKPLSEQVADWGVAWYTLAIMQTDYKTWPLTERLSIDNARHNELGGYLVIGTFITPKAP